MENNLSPRLLSDLEEFRQQALRCVNDATFAQNIMNSLQNLKNQLTNAIEYTQENDIATIQTIQIVKTNGRPRYEISKNLIISLAEHHFTWTQIANLLGISISTLNRRKKELNIS